MRAKTSLPPPAGNGQMNVMVRVGYSCATSGEAARLTNRQNRSNRYIFSPSRRFAEDLQRLCHRDLHGATRARFRWPPTVNGASAGGIFLRAMESDRKSGV